MQSLMRTESQQDLQQEGHYRASILAIGTEVTSGEILNKNATWLARELEALGVEVNLHLAIPDDPLLMKEGLEFASSHSQILFLVGGLGPTQDDLTREVVARWLSVPLEFSEQVFLELKAKLEARAVALRTNHRRQCEFPLGAESLVNSVGTARGFFARSGKLAGGLFALPGPPRELEPMWEQQVVPKLQALDIQPPYQLDIWCCEGVPESEVAELCEELLKEELNHPQPARLGYRASLPKVYVKLWWPRQRQGEISSVKTKLSQALAPWLK